jgi:hypothetical protein
VIAADGMKLIFTCIACRKPVAAGEGWMHVDMTEVGRVEAAVAEWERKFPAGTFIELSDLDQYPNEAQWKVHHRTCDPNPDHSCYWFDVGRCDSWPRLAHWTGHLMGKNWFQHTDWRDLLERIGEDA